MTGHTSGLKSRRSSRLLAGVAVLISAVLAGGAFRSWRSAAERRDSAQANLSECRQLLNDIERLRDQPRVAAIDQETSSGITRRVSQSIQAASLPTTALVRVEPQAPVRFSRTQYRLRSTRIELAGVSLEQLIRFADSLEDPGKGLVVQNLVLTEPQSATGSPERWEGEITLTQTIFSPTIR